MQKICRASTSTELCSKFLADELEDRSKAKINNLTNLAGLMREAARL